MKNKGSRLLIKAGDVVRIPDGTNTYYAVKTVAGDYLFLDAFSKFGFDDKIWKEAEFFLRLDVSSPSIKRGGWEVIGFYGLGGRVSSPGIYRYQPIGALEAVCYDIATGEISKCDDLEKLEHLAVWDAVDHILPILRMHFLDIATPLAEEIVAKL